MRIVWNDTNIEFVTRLPLNQRRILIPMIITTKYLLRNLRESRAEVQKEQDTMKLRGTPAEPCAAPSQVRRHSVPDFVFCTSVVRRLCRQFSETVYSASFILMMSGRREGHDCILNYIEWIFLEFISSESVWYYLWAVFRRILVSKDWIE